MYCGLIEQICGPWKDFAGFGPASLVTKRLQRYDDYRATSGTVTVSSFVRFVLIAFMAFLLVIQRCNMYSKLLSPPGHTVIIRAGGNRFLAAR
jgi:hypothetical protein